VSAMAALRYAVQGVPEEELPGAGVFSLSRILHALIEAD